MTNPLSLCEEDALGRKTIRSRPAPDVDVRFSSRLVSKFISCMMYDGKRSTAQTVFYRAMDLIQEKTGQDGLTVFKKAVDNVKPVLEVRSRRVGGATYQVPIDVRPLRKTTLAIRWLIQSTRARPERTMADKLAGELTDAAENQGVAIKKKQDTHKMAEANKAFAHYRW